MSATDELLTLLKEQGFEHYEHEAPAEENCIAFYDGNRWHDCWESVDGEVNVTFSMTPAQAIAATMGRGTCRLRPWEMERDTGFYDCMECDCGHVADVGDWAEWHFCPNCGAKVVDE